MHGICTVHAASSKIQNICHMINCSTAVNQVCAAAKIDNTKKKEQACTNLERKKAKKKQNRTERVRPKNRFRELVLPCCNLTRLDPLFASPQPLVPVPCSGCHLRCAHKRQRPCRRSRAVLYRSALAANIDARIAIATGWLAGMCAYSPAGCNCNATGWLHVHGDW